MRRFAGIDVLLCRNMLIYLDGAARRTAINLLYEALAPGGFICLGHSEPMSRISGRFAVRGFGRSVVYQKQEDTP